MPVSGSMQDRSVLLLATNKKEYLQFALNCAQSIKLHNPDLQIFIATNIAVKKTISGITFLSVSEDLAKLYIEAKIYLDSFLQTQETLFIDSDCLCYGNLEPLFKACRGMDVTVVGRPVPLESYWGTEHSEFARKEFGIDKSIVFNGGFYYFKKSALTKSIFDKAREISSRYDEYGFHRIKNKWKNEEELLSIGMVVNKQTPIADNGTYMTDLYTNHRPATLNVLTGARELRNPAYPVVEPRSWYPAAYSPILLHFGGSSLKSYPYVSQSALLRLHNLGLPVPLASALVYVFIDTPFKTYYWFKKIAGAKRQ